MLCKKELKKPGIKVEVIKKDENILNIQGMMSYSVEKPLLNKYFYFIFF